MRTVDIVISNEDEGRAHTGCDNEEEAMTALARDAEIAVLKRGSRGSLIACGGEVISINAMTGGPVKDTTGAGDLWASGFLYGLLRGFTLEKCGMLGSACGGRCAPWSGHRYRKRDGRELKNYYYENN